MSQPQPPPVAGPGARPTLARELAEFLIELSIVLNRFSIYPSGHPSLGPAADGLLLRLDHLLAERSSLSVGVARQQLIIEGVATDPKNPVLKDLASRLNRQQLGAISLTRGVGGGELLEFLSVVSHEAERGSAPTSVAHDARAAAWSHIRLYPPMYDRLELVEDDGAQASEDAGTRTQRTRAAQLWIGLARAALAVGEEDPAAQKAAPQPEPEPEPEQVPTDPDAVARAIDAHPSGAAYDQVIVGYMLQIAEELRSAGGREALHLQKRMSKLISALDPKTLERLLEMGGDGTQRRTFLLNAAHGMSVDAVVDLIRAASETQQQTVSHSLLRMLQKLARHADAGGERRVLAEQSVRDQVGDILRGWSLADPNPEAYGKALEAMARADAAPSAASTTQVPEPHRIVTMALELDVLGEPVERAVSELVATGFLRWLVEAIEAAPPSSVRDEVTRLIATPETLADALSVDPIDTVVLDALLPQMGTRAIGVLLDALAEVEEARLRRLLLDRLVQLGPEIAGPARDRLSDPRWYVKRNMLKLLGDQTEPALGISPALLEHQDARVRREALRVLLRDPAVRAGAIARALADPDDRVVRTALAAAQQDCPPSVVPAVATLATASAQQEHRVLAIRVLGACADPGALDALLRCTTPRQGLFREKAPAKTPEYLAALAALGGFQNDPRAREVRERAARSSDPEVAAAARGAR